MYDIYKTQKDYSGKLKHYFVVGGFPSFEETVAAIKKLYQIDDIESEKRILNIRTFNVKECTHVDMDARQRDSVRHNQIDRQHNPKADLIAAYYGTI